MYEAVNYLFSGIALFLLSLLLSLCALPVLHVFLRRSNSGRPLLMVTRGFSLTPFISTVGVLALSAVSVLLSPMLGYEAQVVSVAIFIFGTALSAIFCPSLGAVGLYFSILNTVRSKGRGVAYIVVSGISLLISLTLLAIYLSILIPYAVNYYGLL